MVAVAEATPGAAETQAAVEEWVVMKERGMPGMRENLLEANRVCACACMRTSVRVHCACGLQCIRAYTHMHGCMHACIPNVI